MKRPSAKTSALMRAEMIMKVRCRLMTASQAAAELGVSRKTYYKWEQRGLAALLAGVGDQVAGRPKKPPQESALEKRLAASQSEIERLERKIKLKEIAAEINLVPVSNRTKKNEQIMMAVASIQQIKACSGIAYSRLLPQAGIGYGQFMRWKRRIGAGQRPLKPPGPKKIAPFDFDELTEKIGRLRHSTKRTRGTGELYGSYKGAVSRREFNEMVIAVRRDHQQARAAALSRVIWRRPDVVWAIDGTEYRAEFADEKLHIQNLQDLCSVYKFTPLTTGYMPCGEEVAGHLDCQFTRYGPPLFIKRDNGGNLNHAAVNEVLEEKMVIPINSPVNTAPYNGAVEHAQGEVKRHLRTWRHKARTTDEFILLTETTAHDLNHKPRRSLGGRTACRVYFGSNRIRYAKRKRRSVYDWIRGLAIDISKRTGHDEITRLAWRVAAKIWLKKNDLITVLKPGEVLPYFCSNLCHE